MGEIHVGAGFKTYLNLYGTPADAMPTAVLTERSGTTRVMDVTQEAPSGNKVDIYSAILTTADTSAEGKLQVDWTYTVDGVDNSKITYYDVVTPYLSYEDIIAVHPDATDQEIIDADAAVRHIINSNTGQEFGYAPGQTLVVQGNGDRALKLPRRIIQVTGLATLTDMLDPNALQITGDGWYLKKRWAASIGTVESTSGYWEYSPGAISAPRGPVISAPGGLKWAERWTNDYPFSITGDWGYRTVPAPVREAAKLLLADYSCYETSYRDKFLNSIRAADWRLEFSSRSWESTGNVRADQLLSPFVLLDWAVI